MSSKKEEKKISTRIELPESVNKRIIALGKQLGLSRRAYITMLVHKVAEEKAA